MQQRIRLQIWFFLGSLSVAFLIVGRHFWDRHGLLAGFLLAVTMNLVIFFYGDLRLLKRFRCEQLEGLDPWGLLARLEALSAKAGIPTPRLFLIDLATPTALSIGMSRGQNAVLVSEGLVREFSPEEIEAVLAFEVARLKRQDTTASTVAAALTGVFSSLARGLDNVIFLQFLRRKRPGLIKPMTALFSPLISLLSRVAVSGSSYTDSDALAAALIEDPRRIAGVLWKLHAFQKTRPFDVPQSDTPLFMVSPLTVSNWYRYFQVQPAVERRIRLLIGHYPV